MKKLQLVLTAILSISILSSAFASDVSNTTQKNEMISPLGDDIKPGIWVRSGNVGKADFIKKGDYQFYLELEKNGNSWKLSIPCDMETLEFELQQSGNVLKNDKAGIRLEFNGKTMKISGNAVADCQTIAADYELLPHCLSSDYIALAGFFRGKYSAKDSKGSEFKVNLEPVGIMEGWKNFTAYQYRGTAADPILELREPDTDNITVLVVEIAGENINLYECKNCSEMDLDTEPEKGKKLLSLIRQN